MHAHFQKDRKRSSTSDVRDEAETAREPADAGQKIMNQRMLVAEIKVVQYEKALEQLESALEKTTKKLLEQLQSAHEKQ